MRHKWGPKDVDREQACLRGCGVRRYMIGTSPETQVPAYLPPFGGGWGWNKTPDCLPPVRRTEKPEEASK